MVKITLPPKGYFARDLVISTLKALETDEGEVAKDKLKDMILKFREDRLVSSIINRFKKNYGDVVEYLLEEDVDKVVEDFFKEEEFTTPYTLLVPELMEAEKWYGGWNGSSKNKTSIKMSKQAILLASIALSKFRVLSYTSEKTSVIGLAPVDTIMQYQLCSNLVEGERVRSDNLSKLSHMGRVFLFSMYYSDNVCQKLIVMKVSGHRGDIIEDDTFASIKPIIEVWRYVNSKCEGCRDRLFALVNDDDLVNNHSSIDVFNKIANYVFGAVSGSLTADQMGYFIARDTYLKEEALGVITPRVVKAIKGAVELVSREGVYSA